MVYLLLLAIIVAQDVMSKRNFSGRFFLDNNLKSLVNEIEFFFKNHNQIKAYRDRSIKLFKKKTIQLINLKQILIFCLKKYLILINDFY